MKAADLRDGDDPATWGGLDDSWLGTVVVKRLVWPRGVVVGEICAQDAAEMGPAQNDDVVEALPTEGADHPFRERVLPGRAGGGQNLMDPHARDASREGFPVDPISIAKQIRGSRIIRERLDELLGCPDYRGMVGDVEMEEFAPVMSEDDEDEEET
ncbi:MAG TPA: hypothetical protein VI028_03105, partial [Solirubrobacterales bacterium]